jgi:hypothetical protein
VTASAQSIVAGGGSEPQLSQITVIDRSWTATGRSGSGIGVADPAGDDGSPPGVGLAPGVAVAARPGDGGDVSGGPVAMHPATTVSSDPIHAARRSPPGDRRADLER